MNCCWMRKEEDYIFIPRAQRAPVKGVAESPVYPVECMCCFNAFRLTTISFVHMLIVCYWLSLVLGAYYFFGVPHVIGAIILIVGMAMVTVVLNRFEKIDATAQIHLTQKILHQQEEDIHHVKNELESFYKDRIKIAQVWTYRTRPRLDICKQVTRKLMETRWASLDACKEFLDSVNTGLANMESSIGAMDYYIEKPGGGGAKRLLSKDAMVIVKKQLEQASAYIRKNDAREVAQNAAGILAVPNLLSVRVVAAHALPVGTWCDSYDPYVRMRIKEDGEWARTQAINNCASPRWHTDSNICEFRFLVDGLGGNCLECNVVDGNSVMEETFMGEMKVVLDDIGAGTWQRLARNLEAPVDPSRPGLLELDIFCVHSAHDLRTLMPDEEEDDAAKTAG